MSSPTITYSDNLQTQSNLIQLPQEIKDIIFDLCFTSDGVIVDPTPNSGSSKGDVRRRMGVNLLQTCRKLYHETDRRRIPLQYRRPHEYLSKIAQPHPQCLHQGC